ncbi:MAG: hypothetical protein NDI61_06065 [Bdellovibrionaceae bacterium]|nr:hypothetical protein [Pseudobdellovibrionaceae bacterium]
MGKANLQRGPSWPSYVALTMAMVVTAVFFNNCSNEFRLPAANELASLEGLSVCESEQASMFMSVVHPFARAQCVSCHVTTGPAGASTAHFAEANKRDAFFAFQLPGYDKFKAYALNPGHVPGITGSMNQTTIDVADAAWNDIVSGSACAGADFASAYAAKTVEIPIGTTTATAKTLSWNLDTATDRPGEFAGATFEIRIALNTPVGGAPTYYIAGPIVKTAAQGMQVKGISISINGLKYIEGTTFLGVDRYIPAGNTTTPLSSATMLKQMAAGAQDTDTISISFNHLRAADPPVVEPVPTPTPTPTPVPGTPNGAILYANACQACHGTLAMSTKRGRTAEQILAARQNVPVMANNAAVLALTTAEISAIATALAQ